MIRNIVPCFPSYCQYFFYFNHQNSGHSLGMSLTKIIVRETDVLRGTFREAINIQCQGFTFNQDRDYELPAGFLDILSFDSHHLKFHDLN